MRTDFIKYVSLMFVICLCSCNNDDDSNANLPILDENVEIYNASLLENSLVLAVERGQPSSYLMNKEGQKVKEWNFDAYLGNDLEILPNGKLIGIFRIENPEFSFGGFGGNIRIINTDGSIDWEYTYANSNTIAHHDVEMLPNGNVLFLAWEKISVDVAQQAGIDTTVDIFPEVLIEVNPDTNQIVWQWYSYNHIVQDNLPTLPSFGAISDNPQLINFNYNEIDDGDLLHANGIDYDFEKDVVYISINKYSEVWVIDHSTTTMEAASNSGGNFNKGGNLLYRFGNPSAYNNSFGERLFYNNHFPNFLENNEIGAGDILIYSNSGDNIQQSTVYQLKMPINFTLSPNVNNEPEVMWSFTNPNLFSERVSGAVRLSNGNTLICEGDYGFWEVTNSGEVVWKYKGVENGSAFWRAYGYKLDSEEIQNLGL